MPALTLDKYEGLGNDFLVLIDPTRELRFDAEIARALCDRHLGIGADGLLRLSRPRGNGDLLMELRNADGSIAETSGNGMRCAVLAAMDHGLVDRDEMTIETIVGESSARLLAKGSTGSANIEVGMGTATITRRAEFDRETRKAYGVSIGNPHLVLIGEQPDDLVVTEIGPDLETAVVGGQNVELVEVPSSRDELSIDTWERGSGFTLACGSGSAAAAAAVRLAGLVDDVVQVHNPGGSVTVELAGPASSPEVKLTGDARRIATITIEQIDLESLLHVLMSQE